MTKEKIIKILEKIKPSNVDALIQAIQASK
jgi:hypothetical protein